MATRKGESENSNVISNAENDDKKDSDCNLTTDSQAIKTSFLEQNGFSVIGKIGSGTYAKVKLAYSKYLKTTVAIKIVSKDQTPIEFSRRFLLNEIKVVKYLRHENIIKYYQSIETSHRLYIIMQYAKNGPLLHLIQKDKRIPEPRACFLFRQLLSAIDYCHSLGVAHRDIKCENILLDENYNVKLIDFGFAKCSENFPNQQSKSSMMSASYCGSYAYASPEILKGKPYDPYYSDVWAMGCVLYAMIFGRLPFDDEDGEKLMRQVHSPLGFPASVRSSEGVKMCLRKTLAPLKERYSVDELKQDPWIRTAYLQYDHSVVTNSRRNVFTR